MSELSGKEAYEAQKKEREAASRQAGCRRSQSRTVRSVVRGIAVLVLLAALGYAGYLFIRSQGPQGEDFSRSFPIQGRAHIPIGAEHEVYNSNPPTSGSHYAEPARPGFRGTEQIADGHLIHSLEHGLIWISYQPDVPVAVVEALKDFDDGLTVITQREANGTDIAVAAWGRLDTFDLSGDTLTDEEQQRIEDFIARYVNRGPERITGGHGGV